VRKNLKILPKLTFRLLIKERLGVTFFFALESLYLKYQSDQIGFVSVKVFLGIDMFLMPCYKSASRLARKLLTVREARMGCLRAAKSERDDLWQIRDGEESVRDTPEGWTRTEVRERLRRRGLRKRATGEGKGREGTAGCRL